jgi:RNA polymerase sigma factor (sigma-70 family)
MGVMARPELEVQQLVNDNRTLVEWSVNRYLDRHRVAGAERDDLVSWGLLGLLSAARAYDPGRGLRFSTLAALAIERSITRGAMQSARYQARTLSLDQALQEGRAGDGETRWLEMIPDESCERELQRMEAWAYLRRGVTALRPDQQRLIHAHFFMGYSLADLARQWGTTRQAVAGQLRRALRSIRRGMDAYEEAS